MHLCVCEAEPWQLSLLQAFLNTHVDMQKATAKNPKQKRGGCILFFWQVKVCSSEVWGLMIFNSQIFKL